MKTQLLSLMLLIGKLQDEWNVFTGLFHTATGNRARTRAISELLIEKGIISMEEYNKLNEVAKRDFEEMKRFINEGEGKRTDEE